MVHVEQIEKRYDEVVALRSVSFEINPGELFGFIGPDGAGKTTLFRILTTLILADSGNAQVAGLDVVNDFRKVRQIVGYMPGQFSLYSDLSIAENLDFFATVFGTSVKENYELIRDIYIQIEPFKNRLAGRLSGGMKQKLALCCALIHKPKLLVLDEPTTGVDAVSRKEFWDLLLGLKKQGITILVSTPYMDEATQCDRVALIQKGEILACNNPETIVQNYQEELYSIRATNIYKLLKDLRLHTNTKSAYPFGQDIHYTPKSAQLDNKELQHYLENNGHKQVHINRITAGIEDVFMGLMKQQTI